MRVLPTIECSRNIDRFPSDREYCAGMSGMKLSRGKTIFATLRHMPASWRSWSGKKMVIMAVVWFKYYLMQLEMTTNCQNIDAIKTSLLAKCTFRRKIWKNCVHNRVNFELWNIKCKNILASITFPLAKYTFSQAKIARMVIMAIILFWEI